MAVRVDQAGQQEPPLAVDAVRRPRGNRFFALLFLARHRQRIGAAGLQHTHDLAVVADQDAGETLDMAFAIEGNALDVVDKRFGPHRTGGEQRKRRDQGVPHSGFFNRRI